MLLKLVAGAELNVGSSFSAGRIHEAGAEFLVADLESLPQAEALCRLLPQAPALAGTIALYDEPASEWVKQALRAGVNAILARDCNREDLSLALHAAQAGFVLLHPTSARALLEMRSYPLASQSELSYRETLTPRELDVLRLMGFGLGNKEIASRLEISEHTAKFHASSILGKLGAASRTEAVSVGIRRGLIPI